MNRQSGKDLLRDQRGVVAVIVALVLMMIVGTAALAVDVGYLYVLRNKLQATADAAALAGAGQLPDQTAARAAAQDYAAKNMPAADHGTVLVAAGVVLGNWENVNRIFTPAGTPINAVETITQRAAANNNPAELFFARVFGFHETDITTLAIAWPGPDLDEQTCILSLEPTLPGAIKVSGTVDLDLGGCGISIHSSDGTKAIEVSGSGDQIKTGKICVKGGLLNPGGLPILNPDGLPDPGIIEEGCDPPPDPLAGLAPPAFGFCNETNYVVSGNGLFITLNPGVYCGGIEISGSSNTITYNPGIYILAGGGMKVAGANNTSNGDGLLFYNTENPPEKCGDIDLSGNSDLTLSAQLTGPYAGVLFFQDPSPTTDCSGVKFKVAGTVTANLDGVIYFPDNLVQYSGTSGIGNPCGPKIVSRFVEFNGTASTIGPKDASCASNKVNIGAIKLMLVR